ncbi:hypothetical protein CIHG_03991 [Coccidioides immitis H538.4]|uniref:D-serine dehydratase-like domain-containing protein n=1 Tax=Coccidioides immitis H538.4 TaxID=396776 RepID=A0A0J8UFP7_COCIT|nr:hypothetical protein CIHG_03991 [Coccidioides immitis H538.4]
MSGVQNYPNASTESLKAQYVGRRLQDIDGPAAIIDIAAARQNCQVMLDAAEELGVIFRSHVKTHKTTELTRFQVGEKADTVRLVVSTLAEAEQLRPYLEDCKGNGRSIDVIYGLPVQPSNFVRLATLGRDLGELSITVLVDSLHILPFLSRYRELTGNSLGVFFKLDTGYNRAGLTPDSPQFKELLGAIHKVETEMPETIYFRGFYSHMGRSYGSDTTSEALDSLALEIERRQSFDVELHAGAYVTLDLQQLAAHARPATNNLSFDNLALTVLAEVASLYLHRERPEALIACGSLCMGREPCRSYSGWGVITPWLQNQGDAEMQGGVGWYDPEGDRTGWIIDRLSQEHGILRWQGPVEKMRELRVGEKFKDDG